MAHLVTGYAGYAHIKSADDGAYNVAFFGPGQYVMESGNRFAGSVIDNNTVRILDGDGLMYGRHFRIEPNKYEDLTIEMGTAGKSRTDLVCMVYEKNPGDETEKVYLHVIKGTETEGTPTVPAYTDGNILEGATTNQMPLYKVAIEGVVLSGIEPLFETILSYEGLAKFYYDKFEKEIEENVGELVEIPDNVLAQVELNTAKLDKVVDFGACVYSEDFCIEYDGVPTNDHSYTVVHTFGDFTASLDPNGRYKAVITTAPGLTQHIYIDGQGTVEADLQGCIWCQITRSGYPIAAKNAPIFPYTDGSISIAADMETPATNSTALNGIDIRFRPYLFKEDAYGNIGDVTKTLNISLNLQLRIYQVGYELDAITGGGELPDSGGEGTTNYEDLENKPTINSVVLEGNLTSEDLGLEGGTTDYMELENKPCINGVTLEGDLSAEDLGLSGTGSSGASLSDLGVTATAQELNYMAGATSNVQEQLDDKAASSHTHDGYASMDHEHNYAGSETAGGVATEAVKATNDSLGQSIAGNYIKGLSADGDTITYTKGDGSTGTVSVKSANETQIIFSAEVPTEVEENTIVMVYEE